MYRRGEDYDEIDKTIVDIYVDYSICSLPLNEIEICNKMKVALMPYAKLDKSNDSVLLRKSRQGFFVKESKEKPPTIYYNDSIASNGSKRFTIFHELKHYIYNDSDDTKDKDDLADYFSRHFMCPIPYIMLKGINSPNSIVSLCGMSMSAASNAYANMINRVSRYGKSLFDYEIPLIKQLDSALLDTDGVKILT